MKVNHYYLSASEYSKQTGMGVEEVKRLCRLGRIPCEFTEGGYYKIKIYKDNCISIEEYNKVIKENEKLKTIIKNIYAISKEGLDV